jgi:hypothetical protein
MFKNSPFCDEHQCRNWKEHGKPGLCPLFFILKKIIIKTDKVGGTSPFTNNKN